MNKKVYNLLVTVDVSEKLETILNTYRIGLNDWDKSKVFDLNNKKVINYTVLCDEDTHVSIVQRMK